MENFCKYFAEDKPRYTLEEIARKREKVIEMVEKKVGKRITLANIRDVMTPALMMDIIDKIDKEFFEGKLQPAFAAENCVVSACIENRCTRVAGRCHYSRGIDQYGDRCNRITIKMMSKVFIESFKNTAIGQRAVDDVKCGNILECFILTFEHELTHGIVFCKCNQWDKTDYGAVGNWTGIGREDNGHGKTFMSILFNVFGHTNYLHNLRNGMKVREAGEKEYKQDELSVGDKVIMKGRLGKGRDKELTKVLAVIENINKRIKVKNNITVKVEDGKYAGKVYIIRDHHIIRKIGDPDLESDDEEGTAPKTQTQKKPKTPSPPKSKTVKVKKSAKPKVGDTLLKNLALGDEVIMNARLPGEAARSALLVKIIDINRRKKKKQIRVLVLDKGEYKGKTFTVGPHLIMANPENPVLPASPKTGKEKALLYLTWDSLPLTRKPNNFDSDMDSIDVTKISPELLEKIKKLPRYRWDSSKDPNDYFPEGFKVPATFNAYGNYCIIRLDSGEYILVNTSGGDYIRYGAKLVGFKETAKESEYKDIWPKAKLSVKSPSPVKNPILQKPLTTGACTKRNPAPPCEDGMEVRSRPNGAKCCYKKTAKAKAKPKAKSSPPKTKAKSPSIKKTAKCNKRNPDPPCARGMVERARPNGAICCYKK